MMMEIMDKYVQAGEALAEKENDVRNLSKQVCCSLSRDFRCSARARLVVIRSVTMSHTTTLVFRGKDNRGELPPVEMAYTTVHFFLAPGSREGCELPPFSVAATRE